MIAKPTKHHITIYKNIGQDLYTVSGMIVSWENKRCVKLPINPTE